MFTLIENHAHSIAERKSTFASKLDRIPCKHTVSNVIKCKKMLCGHDDDNKWCVECFEMTKALDFYRTRYPIQSKFNPISSKPIHIRDTISKCKSSHINVRFQTCFRAKLRANVDIHGIMNDSDGNDNDNNNIISSIFGCCKIFVVFLLIFRKSRDK